MGIENAKWYVLHTYSGYENQVEMNLKMVFEKNNLTDRLFEITIPMEEVLEEKNGKKKLVKRKMYPCYVLIKMDYDNSMWHMITNTRGVTGFVGPGSKPVPLEESEMANLGIKRDNVVVNFGVGDTVVVLSGAWEGTVGVVQSMNEQKKSLSINVELFGRETPVELSFSEVKKMD